MSEYILPIQLMTSLALSKQKPAYYFFPTHSLFVSQVEEIREVVDSDLGFQQVETKCPSKTKTFLFISNDKKVGGCLIAEHIQEVRDCNPVSVRKYVPSDVCLICKINLICISILRLVNAHRGTG